MAFVPAGWVRVKMLPYDNKSELEIVLNMPEDSSLERTAQVAREIAAAVRQEKEVTDYQVYVGTAAPYSFNGLMRHYYLRQGSSVAEVQMNLLPKHERSAQSHAIALRIRPAVAAIAARHGARVAVAEVPPGPPVLQSLVAEVYGPDAATRQRLAETMRAIFASDARGGRRRLVRGVSAPQGAPGRRQGEGGAPRHHRRRRRPDAPGRRGRRVGRAAARAARPGGRGHRARRAPERSARRSPTCWRSGFPTDVVRPWCRSASWSASRARIEDRSIYHKNLLPVVYVTGDVAGGAESPAYAILQMNKAVAALPSPVAIYNSTQPPSDARPAIKWDGEWHITLELFRDLGAAFAVVLLLIYGLLVGWFRSFSTPLVVMAAIPFSLVGILPAHAALGAFFTATSMIGFMAGAGIVVRNSIILVDFAEVRIRQGMPLEQAVVDAGAVRFRPDAPHRAGRHRGLGGDPLRPHLPGSGDLAGRGRSRLPAHQPDGGAGALRDGMAGAAALRGVDQRGSRVDYFTPAAVPAPL